MEHKILLKVGSHHTIDNLIGKLSDFGYERNETLSKPGEFSVSGGNLSIHLEEYPVKVELFGNEIDRISIFDIKTNKIVKKITEITILDTMVKLPDGSKMKPGDYIVHDDHGIGVYSHRITKLVENKKIKYLVINYLNNDALFVPENLIAKISSYIGIGGRKPKLNRLGSTRWQKTYKRTYENIIHLARELLLVYAQRELSKRNPWKINKEWDKELIKTFGYRETPDQQKSIEAIYDDLSKDIPADRLVCGDVGFGKTEVAMRAAAQAVANGFQVAILVPTTILAEQHFVTFKKRFSNLPVNIVHLSRIVGNIEQTDSIKKIETGTADVVIGTHKLFNSKIKYKNLGLLIIDEEQKFGVKDKEKLKKLKVNLNILTLTATPIPRTLFMSLSGIRDLSQISSPPSGRKEIETKVSKYNEEEIKNYIENETKRAGQIYYLHNEVATIGGVVNKLRKMFPKLKIEAAHGQQSEKILVSSMKNFANGEINILVCSTIIENGLDIPNVNTLIVENSDKFGLSQLYQIRGRIGRSKKQAYALFTYKDKQLTNNAFKRLKAIVENTELGSGYNIALSDLEIRGGGNILGREQHGNMEAIGLVLYTKMLNEAVSRLKKENVELKDKSRV